MSEQRVLIVTGASAGVGAALAQRAARSGYAVLAVARSAGALDDLKQRVEREGGRLATLVADVREPESSRRIVEAALRHFGRIDVVVANAGVAGRGPLALQDDAALREQIETHLYAPVTLIRASLAALAARRGCAFVVGSGVARIPIGGMGLYPASKAALRSAARTLRRELAPLGIGMTYVDPGVVDTDFMRRRGMPGAPPWLLVSPHAVARGVLHAVESRPTELAIAPWQTFCVAIGERFPRITDFVLSRADALTGVTGSAIDPADPALSTAVVPALVERQAPPDPTLPDVTAEPPSDALEAAIAPLRNRMTRLKLPVDTVRKALVPGTVFDEDAFALAWAGMPNKNERKLVADIALALQSAGFLQPGDERTWSVIS